MGRKKKKKRKRKTTKKRTKRKKTKTKATLVTKKKKNSLLSPSPSIHYLSLLIKNGGKEEISGVVNILTLCTYVLGLLLNIFLWSLFNFINIFFDGINIMTKTNQIVILEMKY